MLDVDLLKASANDRRQQIPAWRPERYFPPRRDGDLIRDGVCSLFIAQKPGVSRPTCGAHLKILARAGLVRSKKIKQWVFYRRDEARVAEAEHRRRLVTHRAGWITARGVPTGSRRNA
ncbi:hypothetical protein Acsp04_03760 [Actinomadura sp. NBRC 104425]|uniref:ArsR/SmtB family transcription factor n=1 Tax=Actinomadura sp. NBRC 104425 TaxID=3032204 RepID=UPI0024A581B3|nr:helix-turn-helix domain-containing protein [Actinomadura sp. NBRC 104425]GLZ10141.1 hypothetical protein Acsp04_03760 [Actinomadura sp. NBRC 104425]